VLDGIVDGLGSRTRRASGALRHLQTGQAQWYAAALFIGVVGIVLVFTRLVSG
jgi:hypothetical protein